MVLNQKNEVCKLQVTIEPLPQAEEFKDNGLLFQTVDRTMQDIDRKIGMTSAVLHFTNPLCWRDSWAKSQSSQLVNPFVSRLLSMVMRYETQKNEIANITSKT